MKMKITYSRSILIVIAIVQHHQRIILNETNGDLTILNVSLNDQGDYFYWFWSESQFPNTGKNYQINLQVEGKLLCNG